MSRVFNGLFRSLSGYFTASAKDRTPQVLLLGVPRLPAGHRERMNGLVLQHRSPHLSREKVLGAGGRPSFSVRLLPGSDPHAASGELPRMPVHRPPLGPLQHFLTQPSGALQGTSVHSVQSCSRQTVLHVSLRGYIHTNTGGSAGRQDTAPAEGGSPSLDLPGDHCPRLRPQCALQPAPSRERAVRADPLHFRLPAPLGRGPSPTRLSRRMRSGCVGAAGVDLENPAPAQQSMAGRGLWPAQTPPFAYWRRPLNAGCRANCRAQGRGPGGVRGVEV